MLIAMRFAAKRKVFWCKTQGVLVQNARYFAAKRSAKCGEMQGEKHKYPLQWYKQNHVEP